MKAVIFSQHLNTSRATCMESTWLYLDTCKVQLTLEQRFELHWSTGMWIFSSNHRYCFQSVVGNPRMQRADCAWFCTLLRRGLEHTWVLVFTRASWNQSPVDPEGPLRLWGVKSYMWIFNCTGVSTPNPQVVQGSAVVVATSEKSYYIQVLEAIAVNFLCKPNFMYIYLNYILYNSHPSNNYYNSYVIY